MSVFDAAFRTARRMRLNDNGFIRRAVTAVPPLEHWLHEQWNMRQHLVPADELLVAYGQALDYLAQRHGPDRVGDYLEFGVFRGESMLCMQQALEAAGLSRVRMIGFDSFEGMPESMEPGDTAMRAEGGVPWKPQSFYSTYEATRRALTKGGVQWDRTVLVKGWYDETLVPEMRQRLGLSSIGVVMVDCVLYSSTRLALAFCGPLITDEAVFVFDDWGAGEVAEHNLGEKAAFEEFLAERPELAAHDIGGYIHSQQDVPTEARMFAVQRRPTPDTGA
jgi:O-methyltransferase